jgi:hypothetical protein
VSTVMGPAIEPDQFVLPLMTSVSAKSDTAPV